MVLSLLKGYPVVVFLQTLCTVRNVLYWRADYPSNMRFSFCFSDLLVLKIFLLPLLVRINPLVKVRTIGVEFCFGPAEFWFAVTTLTVLHTCLLLLGLGVAVSLKVNQAPSSTRRWAETLPFPLILKLPSSNLRWGCDVTSHKTGTFLRTNRTHKGGVPFPSRSPSSGLSTSLWKLVLPAPEPGSRWESSRVSRRWRCQPLLPPLGPKQAQMQMKNKRLNSLYWKLRKRFLPTPFA